MPEITLQGESIEYTIFRRKNNKYVRISVTRKGAVRVSVPWHYPNKFIPGVIKRYDAWILKQLAESKKSNLPGPWQYSEGSTLPFLGKEYVVRYGFHSNGNAHLRLQENTARIELPAEYRHAMNKEGIDAFILGWYRHQAHRYIPRRTEQLAAKMGVRYAALRLKDLRSRWGSCSEQKNINFNIRLMMLPKRVVDYVIIHELAHLRELNHSRRFWNLVARYCPQYQSYRDTLRQSASLLAD